MGMVSFSRIGNRGRWHAKLLEHGLLQTERYVRGASTTRGYVFPRHPLGAEDFNDLITQIERKIPREMRVHVSHVCYRPWLPHASHGLLCMQVHTCAQGRGVLMPGRAQSLRCEQPKKSKTGLVCVCIEKKRRCIVRSLSVSSRT